MRLNDADALEKKLNERYDYLLNKNGPYDHYTDGYGDAVSAVEDFPTIDAEVVVRCKDCRYFKMYKCRMGYSNHDDFCSYGERKEDGT